MGKIKFINLSETRGISKLSVEKAKFIDDFGIEGDAHAGKWHRQVSFLADEEVIRISEEDRKEYESGEFAENIRTEGIELSNMIIGEKLKCNGVTFTISQLGKVHHDRGAVFYSIGKGVMPQEDIMGVIEGHKRADKGKIELRGGGLMPREGIYGVVSGTDDISVGDTIEKLPKEGFTCAVITLSDKGFKGDRIDETGPIVLEIMEKNLNLCFTRLEIMADEQKELEEKLKYLADYQQFDIIVTNGSTGIAPRDIAPDATLNIIEKRLPGFEEAMRMESFKKTNRAVISRAVAGTRKNSFIINLPGSPKGARENLEVIVGAVEHTVLKLQGDKTDCAVK